MKIKILGTGGAINNGLPYNSFIINGDLLVETPPDIMISLFREAINRREIKTIYISHFHADHCFGLPFLLLRNFIDKYLGDIRIIGPKGIEQRVTEICTLAFGAGHLMQEWISSHVIFQEIESNKNINIDNRYELTPVKMFHSPETYGFLLEAQGKKTAYIADTYWEESLLECMIDADSVVIDLNGEQSDTARVHISEHDLVQQALPKIKNKDIRFYGTHLKEDKSSNNKNIRYLKPGETIEV